VNSVPAVKCAICGDVVSPPDDDIATCSCGEVYFGVVSHEVIFGAKSSDNVLVEEGSGGWVPLSSDKYK